MDRVVTCLPSRMSTSAHTNTDYLMAPMDIINGSQEQLIQVILIKAENKVKVNGKSPKCKLIVINTKAIISKT